MNEDKLGDCLRGSLVVARYCYRIFSALYGGCLLLAAILIVKTLLGYSQLWIDTLLAINILLMMKFSANAHRYLVGIWGRNILTMHDMNVATVMLRTMREKKGWL